MRILKNHPSADQLESYDKYPCYDGNDLELVYTPEQSVFTLWAPNADRVRLNLHPAGEGEEKEEQLDMDMAEDGTWRINVDRDLKGSFYTFQIEKDGKWLDETPGIWAKAVVSMSCIPIRSNRNPSSPSSPVTHFPQRFSSDTTSGWSKSISLHNKKS